MSEFGQAVLGHAARRKRAVQMAATLRRHPGKSLPKVFASWGQTRAAYSLLSNRHVTHAALLSGHRARTVERCRAFEAILVPQDTTSLNYGERPGLGPIDDKGKSQGMLVHTSLAVSATTHEVLGVLDQQVWTRSIKKKPRRETGAERKKRKRESEHWGQGQVHVAEALGSGDRPRVIAVFDREGDIFEAFEQLDALGHSFIIRACRNRLLEGEEEEGRKYLLDEVLKQPVQATTTVDVLARPGRPARRAKLEVRAMETSIQPPNNRRRTGASLALNVVVAREIATPEGCEPLLGVDGDRKAFRTDGPCRS